jgi:hypothetical protein
MGRPNAALCIVVGFEICPVGTGSEGEGEGEGDRIKTVSRAVQSMSRELRCSIREEFVSARITRSRVQGRACSSGLVVMLKQ